MTETCVLLNASHDALWDDLVALSPQGSDFMRSDWLRMLAATQLGELQFDRIGCFDKNDKLIAGWAIPYYQKPLGLRFSIGGFGLRYSGPLLSESLTFDQRRIMARNQALRQFSAYARANFASIVVECHPSFTDPREFIYDGWTIAPEYHYVWDLTEMDALFGNLGQEKRREIRRGLESYQFGQEWIDKNSLAQFLAIYSSTMQERHSIGLDSCWQENLQQRLTWMQNVDGCRLYAAKDGSGKFIAMLLTIISRGDKTVHYWMIGYDQNIKGHKVLPALYWFTALAIRNKDPEIQFVSFGVSPTRTLSKFKDLLGAQHALFFRMIYQNNSWKYSMWQGIQHAKELARPVINFIR